ncbi:MAG: glycosyltransferase [Candidatus Gottesmanbacteria bacterium]
MITASIGIMAYNEANNIGQLLERLCLQRTKKSVIKEIIVIASGCTDGTYKIIKQKIIKDQRIKLIIQNRRLGKASAINIFIQKAESPILVMISADTLPCPDTIEELLAPFINPRVGITSAQIISINQPNSFMGYFMKTFWELHHQAAKEAFKGGELIAWKNVVEMIDPETSADETNIAGLIFSKKFKAVYVPRALVYNCGPTSVSDYILMRRRQIAGHYHLREVVHLSYLPPTLNNIFALRLYLKFIRPKNLKQMIWFMGIIPLEVVSRILAWYDWRSKGEHYPIWPIAKSTKKLPEII